MDQDIQVVSASATFIFCVLCACLQSKKTTKKSLHSGKGAGTGASAGLDDYMYDDAGQGDDDLGEWG